ncbi:methyl-accepting chemotaxis protein [Blastomonas aquatica]|uniref:Methyl-accepting chemotaxis protein n=1 Tax=Blastomonas aquatica TaxID=1510276 RepID=A0ABQ1JM14_9SPHN|nr:methyl-accepting chemotaxis protein [Blastomonas aquatica]GGB69637.1 methyl-accepting chemotaxis protein [Blastomonas aquatica]
MNTDLSLEGLRHVGMRLVAGLIAALAAVACVMVIILQVTDKWPAALLALLLAAYPAALVSQRRTDASARMTVSITVVAMPALLLFLSEGLVWQTDLHMLFFALLAAASILCDWKALAAATAVVATHHLGLGMIMPQWLFSGDGSLARIALHAIILVVEAATLIWVAQRIVALVDANDAQAIQREKAAEALAAERAEQARIVQTVTTSLGKSLTALAAGSLTERIIADFPSDYALLKRDYNDAVSSVHGTVVAVSDSAAKIRSGSSEIARASEDLARRTESTAASLEEASAALIQIEGRLKATAASAQNTVARADQAMMTVDSGRTTARTAMHAMDDVSGSAKGIDDVIAGLDKIAFQTRVLAMNAAVEAGRAGDAGRGFAVVADLVSALAMRAEEEAKRARDQLGITQSQIVTAVEAVGKLDTAFAAIAGDVGAVTDLLSGMASDNQGQSTAMSEITSAVSAMDAATQQNASMVEQTSAAARNLTHEVDNLASAAARFDVDGGDPRHALARREGVARPSELV